MRKQRIYKYYNGDVVFTYDGTAWFKMDMAEEIMPIEKPNMNQVAIDMTTV